MSKSKRPKSEAKKLEKESSLKFRDQALKELHSPDQLDTLIQVVPERAWIWLWAIYLLLGSLILWGIFGSIPTRVQGRGILLVENGLVYNAVSPPGGGRIVKILITQGNIVKKGDIIAYLERPDLAEKVNLERAYLIQLKNEQAELIKTSERELTERDKSIIQQQEKLNSSLEKEKANLKDIEKVLSLKEEYFKKGYVVLQDIESTRRDYYATEDRINQVTVQLEQNKNQQSDFEEQWRKQLKDKELSVLAEQLKFDNLESELVISKAVQSPVEGIVISINTSIGKMVQEGGSIATITNLGEGLDALVFMLPHEGERVSVGMRALATPVTIEKEEYGSMIGKVLNVSTFPEASDTIVAILHNPDLAKEFAKEGAPIGIRVRLEKDPNTASGYKWTSSKGPNQPIIPGTLVDARITVREQAPISLIIPAFKKLLRISY